MERIDLHVHSNASDGSLTPTEVADEAMRMGLSAIALTDHDTVDGVAEILDYTKDKPLEVVPGIELSCYYNNREIHILGFYMDYENPKLQKELAVLKEAREGRQMVSLSRWRSCFTAIRTVSSHGHISQEFSSRKVSAKTRIPRSANTSASAVNITFQNHRLPVRLPCAS